MIKDKVVAALNKCNTTLFIVNCTDQAHDAIYEFESFFDKDSCLPPGKGQPKQKLSSAIFILVTDIPSENTKKENSIKYFNREAFVGRILAHVPFP